MTIAVFEVRQVWRDGSPIDAAILSRDGGWLALATLYFAAFIAAIVAVTGIARPVLLCG